RGAKSYPHTAWKIVVLLAVTTAVFWLAHVYAHGLGHVLAQDRHLSFAELRRIARHEAAIVEAALPPLAAMLLAAVVLISTRASIWIAYGLGLAVLVTTGLVFARVERLGWLGTLLVLPLELEVRRTPVALR